MLNSDYEDNLRFYYQNDDYHEYVDRYCQKYGINTDTAFKHMLMTIRRQTMIEQLKRDGKYNDK